MDIDSFPSDYVYKQVASNIYKMQIKTKEDVDTWVEKLEYITKETWRTTRTFNTTANAPRILYKRSYHCHFKSHRRSKTLNVIKKKSKNIDCPAKMIITIQKYIFDSKSKKEIKVEKDWPCVVEFQEKHNHKLNVIEALRERPVGAESKTCILELFNRGHSVSSAYHTFCSLKMEEYGDDYEKYAYDSYYFPTKTDVATLWKINFKKHYGETYGENMLVKLDELLSIHNKSNGTKYKIVTEGTNYAVVLCTPIMQRTLTLPQANEIMFVDATGNCDAQDHKVYFFLTQSAAGGIPIGCIISSSQKADIFNVAVEALYDIMVVKIQPQVIITDNDLTERNALGKIWPNSKLLLCTFHVLKACWKWLSMKKNCVEKNTSQIYYKLFRNILYAKTDEALKHAKEEFDQNCQHSQFTKYVYNMYLIIDTWCLLFRQNLMLRGTDTNNYSEVMFRLLKDIPLERTKAFNITQLADFIVTSFECYYKQRILDLLFQRNKKTLSNRYFKNFDTNFDAQIFNEGNMEFKIQSFSNTNLYYDVDMLACKCTCPEGFNGKYCKHQATIIKKYNIITSCNTLSYGSKIMLYEIATGKTPDKNMFLPLLNTGEENQQSNYDQININLNENVFDNQVNNKHIEEATNETIPSEEEIEAIKLEWQNFTNDIMNHLTEDPVQFYPAIQKFLQNKNKYALNTNGFLTGLHTAFKYNCITKFKRSGTIRTQRKGKQINVQPTAIGRRTRGVMGGKRRNLRRGQKRKYVAPKAPHSLSECVRNNVGLGNNKQKK